jgi:hypothetical protein
LSNPVSIGFPQDSFTLSGLSISPNSRFLYAAARTKLYQFDLWEVDIADSRILIDTLDLINIPAFGAVFHLSQLAPDNKIYIAGSGSHLYLHVINNPDSLGTACNFVQQGVEIPALNFASIPNFPNYRLGVASEPCDSIMSAEESVGSKYFPPIDVFPNPVSSLVNIKIEETRSLHDFALGIFDLTGRIVVSEPSLKANNVSVAGISSGAYFYSIKYKERIVKTGKLIIIK